MFRRCLLSLLLALSVQGASAQDAPSKPWRFRIGPFFEIATQQEQLSRLAIRPFFAWEKSQSNPTDRDMEVIWPLSHFEWNGTAFHWRFVLTFWQEADTTNRRSADYSLSIPPIWAHGRDQDEPYWGLFPLYGKLPKFFLTEDFQWALFPLWLRYRTSGTRAIWRDYYVWPFFSLKYDPDATRWALWPLYGTKRETDFDARFVLWPIWNDQSFHAPRHTGSAWMLWPLCERINADTEQGWGFIPPLFRRHSYNVNALHITRAPWPLLEHITSPTENTWQGWRFWGISHRGTRDAWWLLDPILAHRKQTTPRMRTDRFTFWPLYTDEEQYTLDAQGTATLKSHYFRIWPFYSSTYNSKSGLVRKALVLFPIRDVPAVERNWSPFWTLYSATQVPGEPAVQHELFWGLIRWETHPQPAPSETP